MLSLAGEFMIERWMSLLCFIRSCILSQFEWGAKTNCGGLPPKKVFLRSKISLEPCPLWKVVVFLGRVYRGPSLPLGAAFFV
jgi:hypothetical protein